MSSFNAVYPVADRGRRGVLWGPALADLRRGALAIGLFFLYAVVLENALAGLMNHYLNYSGRYLPLESSDNLIPFPLLQEVQNKMMRPINTPAVLIAVFIYLGLYLFFSYRKFETDDL